MRSMKPQANVRDSEDACEIIELAIGDLETLTRAFHVIKEVCEERASSEVADAFDLSNIRAH